MFGFQFCCWWWKLDDGALRRVDQCTPRSAPPAEATTRKSSLNTIAALFCNSIEKRHLAEIF
jgi:hypothetical protein